MEPDIIGVFFGVYAMQKGDEEGCEDVERVYCGEEESAGHAPQTLSVSVLDHALMRHLCESQPSARLADTVSACQCFEKQQQPRLTLF